MCKSTQRLSFVSWFPLLAVGVLCFVGPGCSDDTTNGQQDGGASVDSSADSSVTTCTAEYQYTKWSIKEDRRLIKACSPYVVSENISVVGGATLTIDPGVVVKMDQDKKFQVAHGDKATLVAKGTAADPITITSNVSSPAAGDWGGLELWKQIQKGTVLSHVRIRHGGQKGKGACLLVRAGGAEGNIELSNVAFDSCGSVGLQLDGPGVAKLEKLSFKDILDYGMKVKAALVGSIKEGFTYSGVKKNFMVPGTIGRNTTWESQDVPWDLNGDLFITDAKTQPVLTLKAGVHLRFLTGRFWIGYGSAPGGLLARGTAAKKIVFESALDKPTPGSWGGLIFGGGVLSGSVLEHAVVRHGGSTGDKACVAVRSTGEDRLEISNTAFEKCKEVGLYVQKVLPKALSGLSFKDIDGYGLKVSPETIGRIKGAFTYSGVTRNAIIPGTVARDTTWLSQPVPWFVAGELFISHTTKQPVLTINGGTTVRFSTGRIWIGYSNNGGLVTKGTAAKPVVLESALKTPAAGDWIGLVFGNKTLAGSALDYTTVRHAGKGGKEAALTFSSTGTNVTIKNSTFSTNKKYDLWVDCKSTPTLSNNTYKSTGGLGKQTGC